MQKIEEGEVKYSSISIHAHISIPLSFLSAAGDYSSDDITDVGIYLSTKCLGGRRVQHTASAEEVST